MEQITCLTINTSVAISTCTNIQIHRLFTTTRVLTWRACTFINIWIEELKIIVIKWREPNTPTMIYRQIYSNNIFNVNKLLVNLTLILIRINTLRVFKDMHSKKKSYQNYSYMIKTYICITGLILNMKYCIKMIYMKAILKFMPSKTSLIPEDASQITAYILWQIELTCFAIVTRIAKTTFANIVIRHV